MTASKEMGELRAEILSDSTRPAEAAPSSFCLIPSLWGLPELSEGDLHCWALGRCLLSRHFPLVPVEHGPQRNGLREKGIPRLPFMLNYTRRFQAVETRRKLQGGGMLSEDGRMFAQSILRGTLGSWVPLRIFQSL